MPIRNNNKPIKEELYDLYIIKNLKLKDLQKIYNIDYCVIRRWLNEYNIKKDSKLIAKQRSLTVFQKYGVNNVSQLDYIKEKKCKTCIKKYGVLHYNQSQQSKERYNNSQYTKNINNKIYITKKNNNTITSSKKEDYIYQLLINKFGKGDIIRQYKSELYPFACDFYIKSQDLYIEYQGYWTHGTHAFTNSNIDLEIINHWKQKITLNNSCRHDPGAQYKEAIKIWTQIDPLKEK